MNGENILLVTRSIDLQHGLGALLESLPGVSGVKILHNLTGVYAWIAAHAPALILLDECIMGKNSSAALQKIYSLAPGAQCILLVNEVQNLNFLNSEVEMVILKGAAPAALVQAATILLDLVHKEDGDKS